MSDVVNGSLTQDTSVLTKARNVFTRLVHTAQVMPAWTERVAVRSATAFLANGVRAGLSFLAGLLVARGLGPSNYGDLSFLLGSFTAFAQFIDAGTSSAFYTFLSRRRRSRVFFSFYLGWLGVQFLGTTAVVGLLLPTQAVRQIWFDQDRGRIMLAFFSTFLVTQVWGLVSQLGEARRRTIIVQGGAVAQALVHVALLAVLSHFGRLTIAAVLWLLAAEYFLLALVLVPPLIQCNLARADEAQDSAKIVAAECLKYCKPLLLYGWVGFAYTFADRWLLQKYGGSVQQGYFSVGQQFANISLIATTSVLKVFWKEIAEANARGDQERVRKMFHATSRTLYFSSAWLSCLLFPYSTELLRMTVGVRYSEASLPLTVMFLYPIHQSLGQIQGTFFYATADTRKYVAISILGMLISIPLTYIVLAPRSAWIPGFALGSLGVACKLIIVQMVQTNIQGGAIARMRGWPFEWGYQFLALAVLLPMCWTTKLASFGNPLVGVALYIAASALVFWWAPALAGIRPGWIREQLQGKANLA